MERIGCFLLGWARDLLKSFKRGKAIEGAVLLLGWKALLLPKRTRDLLSGNGHLSSPVWGAFLSRAFHKEFLQNCDIPVNGFQFFWADNLPPGVFCWEIANQLSSWKPRSFLCYFPAWCIYRRTVVTVSGVCKAKGNESFWYPEWRCFVKPPVFTDVDWQMEGEGSNSFKLQQKSFRISVVTLVFCLL